MAAYRHGLVLVIAFFAAAGVVSAVLLTARPATARPVMDPVGPPEAAEGLVKTLKPNEVR